MSLKSLFFLIIFFNIFLNSNLAFSKYEEIEKSDFYRLNSKFNAVEFDLNKKNNIWMHIDSSGNKVISFAYETGYTTRFRLKNTPYVIEKMYDVDGNVIQSYAAFGGLLIGRLMKLNWKKELDLVVDFNDNIEFDLDDVAKMMQTKYEINIEDYSSLCGADMEYLFVNGSHHKVYKLRLRDKNNINTYVVSGLSGEIFSVEENEFCK